MNFTNSIIALLCVGVVTASFVARNKYNKIVELVNNLRVKLVKIHDIQAAKNAVLVRLDLVLLNNSLQQVTVNSGNHIALKKIIFLDQNGTVLGTAEKHINNIEIDKFGSYSIDDINLVIPTKNIGALIYTFFNNTGISVKAEIEVLNDHYII